MPYKGVVKENMVILEENTGLRDGARVIVIPAEEMEMKPDYSSDPFLAVDSWAPSAPADTPKDLAQRHDYYLYQSKRR